VKTCSSCGEEKPYEGFYKNKVFRDGLTPECRPCVCRRNKVARDALKARSDGEIEAAAAARGPKICKRCGETKAPHEFALDRAAVHGRSAHCLPCSCASERARWKALAPEERKRRRALEQQNNRLTYRKWRLENVFGITLDQYNEMLERQNGLCAICRMPETSTWRGRTKTMSVDHDHETGAVRALLCGNCNAGLGQFKDSPELLTLAALYVSTHKSNQVSKTT
jgi:hypothetical protein